MTPLDLEAIEARLRAATPGPWAAVWLSEALKVAHRHAMPWFADDAPESYRPSKEADAALISHAPTDIASLLAEVRRLRALLDSI